MMMMVVVPVMRRPFNRNAAVCVNACEQRVRLRWTAGEVLGIGKKFGG